MYHVDRIDVDRWRRMAKDCKRTGRSVRGKSRKRWQGDSEYSAGTKLCNSTEKQIDYMQVDNIWGTR